MKTRIYKPHTDNGKQYNPPPEGMDVELDETSVAWLKANRPDVLEAPQVAESAAAEDAPGRKGIFR